MAIGGAIIRDCSISFAASMRFNAWDRTASGPSNICRNPLRLEIITCGPWSLVERWPKPSSWIQSLGKTIFAIPCRSISPDGCASSSAWPTLLAYLLKNSISGFRKLVRRANRTSLDIKDSANRLPGFSFFPYEECLQDVMNDSGKDMRIHIFESHAHLVDVFYQS